MPTPEKEASNRTTDRDRLLAETKERPGIAASLAAYEAVREHLPQQPAVAAARTGYSTGANGR